METIQQNQRHTFEPLKNFGIYYRVFKDTDGKPSIKVYNLKGGITCSCHGECGAKDEDDIKLNLPESIKTTEFIGLIVALFLIRNGSFVIGIFDSETTSRIGNTGEFNKHTLHDCNDDTHNVDGDGHA